MDKAKYDHKGVGNDDEIELQHVPSLVQTSRLFHRCLNI